MSDMEKQREYQRRYRERHREAINARENAAQRLKRQQKDRDYFEAETARSMGALRKVRATLDARDIRRAERREAEAAKRTRLAWEVNMLQRATL